jgi:lipopolysaccharide export system permease protein
LNIALALIALAGLLGGEFSRQGYMRRILWAAGLALLVRLLALSIQEAAADDPSLNAAQYAFPLLVSVVAAVILVRAGIKAKSKPSTAGAWG